LSILKIPTAKVFEPLLVPARYKGVYGGRGSGKSHFFGELLVETCQAERGTLAVCIREAQRTLAQSSKRLIESKIASLGVGSGFKLFNDKIETPGDGLIIFRGLQDHTAESIKSLEGFRIAWIDEAQTLSARSLALLRPTIRAENSELWASWASLGLAEYALLAQGHRIAMQTSGYQDLFRPVALWPPGCFAFWAHVVRSSHASCALIIGDHPVD
jgi:phage terminase large subunit